MRNNAYQTKVKVTIALASIFLLFFWGVGPMSSSISMGERQEQETKGTETKEELVNLITESDLYCSFFILEDEKLEAQIIGAEREEERIQLNVSDVVYVNKGRKDGLEPGQMFLILEVGSKITNQVTGEDFGYLALKRGRARILALEEERASARVERACGRISVGHYLVPFEEKEIFKGEDLGYKVPPYEGEGAKGLFVYLQEELNQIGSGDWALIDLGEEDGLQLGQQLIVYRRLKKGVPIKIIGNVIVIDVQKNTSTVKVLNCKDVIRLGESVQTRAE